MNYKNGGIIDMNKYKIQLKTNINKEIIVSANTRNEAFEFIEKAFLNSDLLDFSNKDIETVNAKILEENDRKVEEILQENEKCSNEENDETEDFLEEIINEIKEGIPKEDRKFYCPECGCPILIDDALKEILN